MIATAIILGSMVLALVWGLVDHLLPKGRHRRDDPWL